jgi:ATP synthase protein I
MKDEPKYKRAFEGVGQLSLGISVAVAILIGVGIGFALKSLTGYTWLLWLGVFWGVAAAINNVYRAYRMLQKELDKPNDSVESFK